MPTVSFEKDNLVVANGDDGSTSAGYFTVVRNGSTMFPTIFCLSVLQKSLDTALEGVDFELPSKVNNTMGGATLSLPVTILNNSRVPGNKIFYVQISAVDNGRIGKPSVLTVTVLDTSTCKPQHLVCAYCVRIYCNEAHCISVRLILNISFHLTCPLVQFFFTF